MIIPKSLILDIPEMTTSTAWWHGAAGHFYNCLVDDPSEIPADEQMFEIAVHNVVPAATVKEKRFSWGIPATNERVESHFTDYDPRVRATLSRVPQGLWKEFSAFSGPRLEKVTAWDKVVLIGDASHPLTGKILCAFTFIKRRVDLFHQALLGQAQLLLCKMAGFLLRPLPTPARLPGPLPLHLRSSTQFDLRTITGCSYTSL